MRLYIGKANPTEWHYYTGKDCAGSYVGYLSLSTQTKTKLYRVFPANKSFSNGLFISKRTALADLKRLAKG